MDTTNSEPKIDPYTMSDQDSDSRMYNMPEVADAAAVSSRGPSRGSSRVSSFGPNEISRENPTVTGTLDDWDKMFCLSEKLILRESNERYPDKRVKVLMINNKTFVEFNKKLKKEFKNEIRLDDRHGSDADIKDLEQKFEQLNYDVSVYPQSDENLTKDKVFAIIQEVIDSMNEYDMLIVIISSHGNVQKIAAYDDAYDISDLLSLFKHKTLENKPKFIILNACRVDNFGIREDEVQKKPDQDYFRELEIEDCILVYGSYPGKAAYRHPCLGARLLRSFRIALNKLKESEEERLLIDLFIDIKRHVSTMAIETTQMPIVTYNLTRRLYIGKPASD